VCGIFFYLLVHVSVSENNPGSSHVWAELSNMATALTAKAGIAGWLLSACPAVSVSNFTLEISV
jgi:hypothetical protein